LWIIVWSLYFVWFSINGFWLPLWYHQNFLKGQVLLYYYTEWRITSGKEMLCAEHPNISHSVLQPRNRRKAEISPGVYRLNESSFTFVQYCYRFLQFAQHESGTRILFLNNRKLKQKYTRIPLLYSKSSDCRIKVPNILYWTKISTSYTIWQFMFLLQFVCFTIQTHLFKHRFIQTGSCKQHS
jgi:hypothetical protein